MHRFLNAVPSAFVLAAAPLLAHSAALASEPEATAPDHPEAAPFDEAADAATAVDAALARASTRGALVMIVMGANWCHDSRALAGWLESERFAGLLEDRYEVVYVDVGHPQRGEGRNLDIAERFGLEEEVTNTPTLLLLDSDGRLINADTAKSWRNAASRSGEEIYLELSSFPSKDRGYE